MSENKPNNNGSALELRVSLSYGDLKVDFSGSPEFVLRSINSFISSQIPEFNLAKKLALNYSSAELADAFQDYVRITPEGPRVMTHDNLSDKEFVALQLVAQKIAYETGCIKDSSSPLSGLGESTGLNPKSLSSRLSELSKSGHVVRESGEEAAVFRISTQGISWLKDVLGKKRA